MEPTTVDTPRTDSADLISRRRILRWAALGAGAAALGPALAACGGDASSPSAAASAGPSGVLPPVPKNGKNLPVLKIGVASLPTTMDPSLSPGNASIRIHCNAFEMLVLADQRENYALKPMLASSYTRVDDRTLELTLNPAAKFHDGSPLTAEDVKFSFDRMKQNIPGMQLTASLMANIKTVDVVDPGKVRVTGNAPDPILEERLSSAWGSWIIPKAYYEKVGTNQFGLKPVGTGPYKVQEFTAQRVVLTRFEDYWGPRPVADRIEYVLYPEVAPRMTALFNGEVDIATQIPPDQLSAVSNRPGFSAKNVVLENMHLLTVNPSAPGLSDPKLRQALSLAIDRQLLVDTLWGGQAKVLRGHQFPQYGKLYVDDYPLYPYDLEKAKSLVQASSYQGEELVYELTPGYYTNADVAAQAVVSMWQKIGVKCRVTNVQTQTRNSIGTWSNSMRFPDPLGGLWLLWSPAAGNTWWKGGDPDFTATGEEMARTMDDSQRKSLAKKLMQTWDTVVPGIPLYYPFETTAVRDGLNWWPYASQMMDFTAANFSVS
ncbi:ABC transporter substrate-binding protein [Dactylosporangium sp. CA-233914]|uniref:ABC transporter substrate-binding protein n=1 Tax=Dactylosporangium sp. CA-233914 TaxID=3239934 RepID=UPI003D928B26